MNAMSGQKNFFGKTENAMFHGTSVRHRLLHERGPRALTSYLIGGVLACAIIGGVSLYEHNETDGVLPLDVERVVAVYGTTIDIAVKGTRDTPVCSGSRLRRRLVIYGPGKHFPATPRYVMDILDDNVASLKEGEFETHLIAELPATIKPDAGWTYEAIPFNGCSFFLRFLPWYHDVGQRPTSRVPVRIANRPTQAMEQELPYVPRPAVAMALPVVPQE